MVVWGIAAAASGLSRSVWDHCVRLAERRSPATILRLTRGCARIRAVDEVRGNFKRSLWPNVQVQVRASWQRMHAFVRESEAPAIIRLRCLRWHLALNRCLNARCSIIWLLVFWKLALSGPIQACGKPQMHALAMPTSPGALMSRRFVYRTINSVIE